MVSKGPFIYLFLECVLGDQIMSGQLKHIVMFIQVSKLYGLQMLLTICLYVY